MAGFDPQFIWFGLVSGSLIALGALGLTLIFGILNFINIAYGEYMAAGAFIAYGLNTQVGLPIAVSGVLAVLIMAPVSVALDKAVFQHFRNRSPVVLLVVSIGLAFILRNVFRIIWGSGSKRFDVAIERAPTFAGIQILPDQVAIILLSLGALGATFLLLQRTDIGIAMRAASDDTDLARIRGVDTERLTLYVWAVGGMIAGIAGVMLGLDSIIRPNMGFLILISIFAAVILGGIGDPVGAVIGGYSIGMIQELSVIVMPSEYKPMVGLLLLVVGLLTRPDGLFGEATR